jgi:hypothetical protein
MAALSNSMTSFATRGLTSSLTVTVVWLFISRPFIVVALGIARTIFVEWFIRFVLPIGRAPSWFDIAIVISIAEPTVNGRPRSSRLGLPVVKSLTLSG